MSLNIDVITLRKRNSCTPSFNEKRLILYKDTGLYFFPDMKLSYQGRSLLASDFQNIQWSPADTSEVSETLASLLKSSMTQDTLLTDAFAEDKVPPLSRGMVCLNIRLITGEVLSEKFTLTLRDERFSTPPPPIPEPINSSTKKTFGIDQSTKDQYFEGWAAFDFGTTNSTVTIFDARKVPPTNLVTSEAFVTLRNSLVKFFKMSPEHLSLEHQKEWTDLCKNLAQSHESLTNISSFIGQIGYSQKNLLFQTVYELEISLLSSSSTLQAWVYPKLQEVYTHMTHTPSLSELGIFVAYLDPTDSNTNVIPSEVQIKSVEPLQVIMGNAARQAREQGIHSTVPLEGQFHSSVKNCLFSTGEDKPLHISDELGQSADITQLTLLRETLNTLKQDTERWCAAENQQKKHLELNELVITYPTIAPPVARRKLKKLTEEIGFQRIDMTYDEATASALFYVLQEYMSSSTRGLSAFQSRSKKLDDRWYQRIMILDIGGGTTDVAMLNLQLHEENPFSPGEDRGAGGKYYVITPQLEISTGELQLGGDLITLKTFKLLKALICDQLLTESQPSSDWQRAEGSLPESYRDADHKYIKRSLVNSVFYTDSTSEGDVGTLIDLQNILLPTNWAGRRPEEQRSSKNAFYTLWDRAEKVKKRLGAKQAYEVISAQELESLFMMLNPQENGIRWPSDVDLRIELNDFEEVIKPYLKESISLAIGLLKNSKESLEVDRIILSGQTCHLAQVHELLSIELSKLDHFIEVNFDPQYSKLSTSIGACYAHNMMKKKMDSKGAKHHLKRGVDVMSINVQNLHFNLPCSFNRSLQTGQEQIFQDRDKLMLLEPPKDGQDEVGAKRTDWFEDTTRRTDVYRVKPSSQNNNIHWGSYDLDLLAESLSINPDKLIERLSVQFEVDQYLNLSMYLCGTSKPAYTYRPRPQFTPFNIFEHLSPMPPEAETRLAVGLSPIRIVTNCAHGGNRQVEDVQVKIGQEFDEQITDLGSNGDLRKMIKKRVPSTHFNANAEMNIYASWGDSDELTFVKSFKRQDVRDDAFPMDYHITLDERGLFALHVAEVPYLFAQQNSDLIHRPGSVLKKSLDSTTNDHFDPSRDPFAGTH